MALGIQTNKFIFSTIIFSVTLHAAFVHASPQEIKFIKEYNGTFATTVKGESKSQPPYISVIRSKEGVTYLFNKFRKIRNLITHSKARHLELELLRNDFSSKMIVAILSHPTDNYEMTHIKMRNLESEQKIEVDLSYYHQDMEYPISPFKSIHYGFYLVKQSNFPVILNAKQIEEKTSKKEQSTLSLIYGTLQNWEDNGKKLVLIDSGERKKRVYYINGDLEEELQQYVGKFMALQGEIIKDSESVYEADFMVDKIVKIY